jgi:UDP-glucose 4-epimerase
VPRSIEDPVGSHRANVDATVQVLTAARDAGVRRLVFAGSSSVYGNAPELPKREDMTPTPLSPYALQKLVAEQYCQMFTRLYGLETVTTRYFNVFGPRQQPGSPYSGVISLFIEARADRRRSTATASRPATSPTSPTSSPACCARARRPGQPAR